MRVLVTGGCGFIGSHVVEDLLGAGHEVRILDDLSTARPGAPAELGAATLVVGSVTDPGAVSTILDGVDAVCHQAAKVGLGSAVADLPDYVTRNDLGTAVLLAGMAAAGVGRLVLASSMVVYGEGGYTCPEHGDVRPAQRTEDDLAIGHFEPGCPTCGSPLRPHTVGEDTTLSPRNGYAATKVAQEHLVTAWSIATGGSAIALRYHNVYGPRLPRNTPYAGVAALFRSALARGEAPRVFEDGAQRRDFVHVTDVARANRLAVEAVGTEDLHGMRAFNVASGHPATVGEMAAALAKALGGPAPLTTGDYRLGDVRHIVASAKRARDQLGFIAAVTLADGMTAFAAESTGTL